jgi:hypothetical protein
MADVNIGPQLMAVLDRYGLGTLATWVSQKVTSGASMDEIMLELYDRPEFKAAFPEIEARRKRAQTEGVSLSPISAEDVLNYRTQAQALMRSYGLPPGFYTNNSDFFNLIVGDVSIDELKSRLDMTTTKVVQAAPEVRSAFAELFGDSSDQALYALATDVDKGLPELEKMLNAAGAGGAATRFGFDINASQMNRLAGYGIDYGQAAQGFSTLADERSLLDESILEDVDLNMDTGIEAAFGLNDESSKALQRRAGARTAQTAGAGGGLMEERGATGLGGAGRL